MHGINPCTHIRCTKRTSKVNHATIQAPTLRSQGLWLPSEVEQQGPFFFKQISEPTADVSLYIYLLYRRYYSNNKGEFKGKKNQPPTPCSYFHPGFVPMTFHSLLKLYSEYLYKFYSFEQLPF